MIEVAARNDVINTVYLINQMIGIGIEFVQQVAKSYWQSIPCEIINPIDQLLFIRYLAYSIHSRRLQMMHSWID